MPDKKIPFSPPDISQLEIDEVVDTLKSGWITTGRKTKEFEKQIAKYCQVDKAICVSSATAGLELVLRLFKIGKGDEVITTPYTYCATANVIIHVGAKPVFVDIKDDEFNISPEKIKKAITAKTKAIIVVDFAGYPCDYDEIKEIISKCEISGKKDPYQKKLKRPILISDSAHSFGAVYKGKKTGGLADFSVFSFHAVKNLTTAEGGAITFNNIGSISSDEFYSDLQLWSLHGQNKDAAAKILNNQWEYKIMLPGYKYNMTDIQASLGLAQLKRYENELLPKRKEIFFRYMDELKNEKKFILPHFVDDIKTCSFHIFPLRIKNINEETRNLIIMEMSKLGISLNVHFIPVVCHPAYKQLKYSIGDYPNTYEMYKNEITLPIYSKLELDDVKYICDNLKMIINKIIK